MFHHGVADNKVNFFGKAEKPEIQRPAIEQEGVAELAMASDELIHDAAARSYEFVFRTLAKQGQTNAVNRLAQQIDQGVSYDNFDRGGGTESRAQWDISPNEKVSSLQAVARVLKNCGYTYSIVTPVVSRM